MQVSIESTGSLGRRMTVSVPSAQLEKEFSTRIQRLLRTAKFPGFRPGKAPLKLVEAQYGGKVMQEVMGDVIQASFYEAVTGKGLKPAGGPSIEPKTAERGRDFEYVAVFEVYPEISRLEISGIKIERPVVQVTEADVDRTLESLRKQRLTWAPVARAAQSGDQLTLDFKGSMGGTPFEGGAAKDFNLVLGSHSLVDGFEEGLIGARAGDQRTLAITFPADYRNTSLAGRLTQFAVTVKAVAEPVLPEVNADFARELGMPDASVDSLRKEVRVSLERELNDRVRNQVRDQVFKAVMQANAVDVPKALEQAEIQRLLEGTRANMAAQGVPADRVPADPAVYASQARQRVALGLILAEFVKVRGLKAEADRVRARIQELAATYESPEKFVEWHYSQPERLAEIESLVLEEQAVELLLQTAEVVDKKMTFLELAEPKPSQG
jgi:trigger factor